MRARASALNCASSVSATLGKNAGPVMSSSARNSHINSKHVSVAWPRFQNKVRGSATLGNRNATKSGLHFFIFES